MEITLEQVGKVKERTGVSYAEAKSALELTNGDVLDAIILLEEKAKEKYEKDKRFYEEHASMMDHAPVPPEYHGTKNVEMTERGQQLLAWYKENIK